MRSKGDKAIENRTEPFLESLYASFADSLASQKIKKKKNSYRFHVTLF